MPTYREKWPTYAKQWDRAEVKAARTGENARTAKRLIGGKAKYQTVEKRTGVPWWMTAVIHEREAGGAWSANLANGDPWNRMTMHVPRGRGPFASWEDAAVDALRYDGLTGVHDWVLEKALYYLESYNGWGYHGHGKPSPYLWGGTTEQQVGKYTSDGNWSPNTMDGQLGCAAMLKAMADLDHTIKFSRETTAPGVPPMAVAVTAAWPVRLWHWMSMKMKILLVLGLLTIIALLLFYWMNVDHRWLG